MAFVAGGRLPGKPLRKICGIPMIGHVYYRSKMNRSLNGVYVATCDKEIEDYCLKNNIDVVMTKDTHERASDRAAEAMVKIESKTKKKTDIAVMIQGDEPMLDPAMIDLALEPMLKEKKILIMNLMSELKNEDEANNPNVVKVVVDDDSNALYFSREPIPSGKKAKEGIVRYKQIAIIPFRRDFLIKFNELPHKPLETIESVDMLRLLEHGYKVKMVLSKFNIYGVDTPEDLDYVGNLLKDDPMVSQYTFKAGRK